MGITISDVYYILQITQVTFVHDNKINIRYHFKHGNENRIYGDNNKIASPPLVMDNLIIKLLGKHN
jgi:hypothetical protein